MDQNVKSPCINICQLNSDNICIGCFRTMEEVGNWSLLSAERQQQIVEDAQKRQRVAEGD